MLKKLRNLVIAGGVCMAPTAHATAISDMSISLDWNSLVITGPLGSPASITDPMTGNVLSSSAEGWVGANGADLNSAYALDGASAVASYTDAAVNAIGGYDASVNESGGGVVVTNAGPVPQSGWGGGYRSFIYQASGTGAVTVSLNYLLTGNVSTSTVYEYANGGYSYVMDAGNADLWIDTYNATIAAGGDATAAEGAADLAAVLYKDGFTDWQLIESPGCWTGSLTCTASVDQSGVLSMTFDVQAGTTYFFGVDATVSGYTQVTQVNAVPVPAAAWLFGSGLLGLVGVVRRKK